MELFSAMMFCLSIKLDPMGYLIGRVFFFLVAIYVIAIFLTNTDDSNIISFIDEFSMN